MSTTKTFKGRQVIAGEISGPAFASKEGFNTCNAWDAFVTQPDTATGVCEDKENTDLYGKDTSGQIMCIPQTVGSSSASCMFLAIAKAGMAPGAMLFGKHVDSLAATGMLMAKNWVDKKIICYDLLGDDFLDAAMQPGANVKVSEDGTVEVSY